MIAPAGPEVKIPADMVLQTGHRARVTVLAFSPTGKILASGSEDETVRLWNPELGRQLHVLDGHTGAIRALAFSRDGALLASGGDDHIIRIWDTSSGGLVGSLEGHRQAVIALSFSPDGKRLVSSGGIVNGEGSAGSVRLWDVIARRQIRTLGNPVFGLTGVFFDSDNSKVSAASQEGDMEIRGVINTYDADSGRLLESRSEILRAVTPTGTFLAIQRGQWSSQSIGLFRQGVAQQLSEFSGDIGTVTFSDRGDWVAYSTQSDRELVVRRATAEGSAATIRVDDGLATTLALNPDGRLLAAAADMTIELWELPDGRLSRVLGPQFGVNGLAFSPDGKRLFSLAQAGGKDAVRVWDLADGGELRSVGAPAGIGVAASPDGALLAVGGRELALWNINSAEPVRSMSCSGDVVLYPAFSPDGKSVAGNCRGIIFVWDVATGALRFQFGQHDLYNGDVIGFSPDGHFLAGGRSKDGFELIELGSGRPVHWFPVSGTVSALAFTPDSRILALGTRAPFRPPKMLQGGGGMALEPLDGQTAELAAWDIRTDRRMFSVPAGHWVSALRFGRNGSSLLAVTGNLNAPGTISAYDWDTGRKTATIRDRVAADTIAVFSPDGHWLAGSTGGLIGIVRLWRVGSR